MPYVFSDTRYEAHVIYIVFWYLINVQFFPAEEPENEAQSSNIDDKADECESMQKLASEDDNFNFSNNSITDSDGNRYH